MARITIITPYYWPEVAASVPLITSLAEDLAGHGHTVVVLTSTRFGERVRSSSPATTAIRVLRFHNPFLRRRGFAAKLLEYVWFGLWACIRFLFSGGPDVCIVSSNPPLLAGPLALIGRLKGSAVVYDLQDLFPRSAVAAALLTSRSPFYRCLQRLESWTYKVVDCVVTISETYRDHVIQVAPSTRVELIPNWVDTDVMRPVSPEENLFLKGTGLTGKFVVLYAGTIGYLQTLDTLVEAAGLLHHIPNLVVAIVGDGQYKARLVKMVERMAIKNCLFFDFQPYDMLPHVYSAGDVCVVPMRPRSDPMPSKTWNIMACERPVLAAADLDSELAGILRRTGAGLVVEPCDPQALAQAILQLYRDPVRRQVMGQAGRRFVEAHLSRRVLTARYEQIVRMVQGQLRDAAQTNQ